MRRRTFLTVAGCVVGTAGCLRLDADGSTATETETPEEPATATPTGEGAGTEAGAWNRTYGGQELDALHAVVDTSDGYLAAGQTGDSDSVESWLVATDTDGMLGQERTYGSGALYSLSQTASGAVLAGGGSMITSADTGDGRLLRQGAIES